MLDTLRLKLSEVARLASLILDAEHLVLEQQYARLLRLRLGLEQAEREVAELMSRLEIEVLDKWAESGTSRQTIEGTTLYVRTDKYFGRQPGISTEDVCECLKKLGYGELVYPTYNAGQVKKLLTEMEEIPAPLSELVKITEVSALGYRNE